jgi:hypothetical protein
VPAASGIRVVAIIAAYNEADIVGQAVGDLIRHGVQVYFLDDGSTDGTVAAVEPYVGRGVLAIEHLADSLPDRRPGRFEWARILARKAEIARTLDADWIIHHDADEFRESPWAGVPLAEAIARVDEEGCNAIDFASFDFWPVDDSFRPGEDVRAAFPYCTAAAPYDDRQVRCWKNIGPVDLASSGGHDVRFEGRRVFPIPFILRHYPIRGQAHGERKILRERRPRFVDAELARGWHVQYARATGGTSFLRDPGGLTRFDGDAIRVALRAQARHTEHIQRELDDLRDEFARTVKAARDTMAGQAAAIAERDEALAERRAAIAQMQADVADLRRRIADIEASLSWRWTAPARAALRLLKSGV